MNKHVSLSLVYDRLFVKKFDNEEFSKAFIESNLRACINFSQFYELLIARLLDEKHGQNTFASAELNRAVFVYFKIEMEEVFYIEARRRQGCELKYANNEIHYTKEKYVCIRVFITRLYNCPSNCHFFFGDVSFLCGILSRKTGKMSYNLSF